MDVQLIQRLTPALAAERADTLRHHADRRRLVNGLRFRRRTPGGERREPC